MKTAVKKSLAFFLAVVMMLGSVPISLGATSVLDAVNSQQSSKIINATMVDDYPLEIIVTTDKLNYGNLNTVHYTVEIHNVSDNVVENISTESMFTDQIPVGNDSVLGIVNKSLEPGKSVSYSYGTTIEPTKLSFFSKIILMFKLLFVAKQNVPVHNYDDGRSCTSKSVSVKIGSAVITDTVKVWYEHDITVINTSSPEEFSSAVSRLVNTTLSSPTFDAQQAANDPYYACRVIMESTDMNYAKLESCKPEKIIIGLDGVAILQFGSRALAENCVELLNEDETVIFAEPDEFVRLSPMISGENVAYAQDLSWGEPYINADKYAQYLESINADDNITVAVVDTGVELNHPFLDGRILNDGRDFVDNDFTAEDENGHGTHVSGIIADCTDNLNVKIMPVRVLNADGGGFTTAIVNGINYAVNNNAKVINLSLGGEHSNYIDVAVNNAVSKGSVVCVAAGNGDRVTYEPIDTADVCPAHLENAIVVAALDSKGNKASFSNYGTSVDVIAPGYQIASAYLFGRYAALNGTSMATPHISAVAAMFLLSHPDFTPAQIELLIKDCCVDLGPAGRDDFYGNGCPKIYSAIPECTLAFNTVGGNSISPMNVKSGSIVVLPTPTKSYNVELNANGGSISTSSYSRNCTFDGWFTDSTYSGIRYANGNNYKVLDSKTLYSKWIDPSLGYVNEPTKSDYLFAGWYTSPSGGTQYTSTNKISESTTLYAHWMKELYTLSYNANGGSGAPGAQTGNGYITISDTVPIRSGYLFKGWSTNSLATSADYYVGQQINLSGNIVLYAVWGKISVTLSSYSGSGTQSTASSCYKLTGWTTGPGVIELGTFYGWRVPLPTPSSSNVSGTGLAGWEVVSGDVAFDDSYMYISKPGTVKVRYNVNGYCSEPYVYTLYLEKTINATNNIRANVSDTATIVGTIPANTTVSITDVNYNGTYKGNRAAWGKVTYGGKTGWIILFTIS